MFQKIEVTAYRQYPDPELLVLLSQDDRKAFTVIYQRYWKLLFYIAKDKTGDAMLAEDIVHDVFASLWYHRNDTSIQSLPHYLAGAVKFCVLASFRKAASERKYLSQLPGEEAVAVAEEALHYKLMLEFILRQAETLPEKCRLIFQGSRQRGLSTRELAELFKLSPKTVENQLHKALQFLRFSLKRLE